MRCMAAVNSLTVVVLISHAAINRLGRKRLRMAQLPSAMNAGKPLKCGLTNCMNRSDTT